MDNIFEKVTLYDILGYLVPGLLFEILSMVIFTLKYVYALGNIPKTQIVLKILENSKNISGIITLGIIILAYCIGLVISEFGNLIENLWRCIGKKEKKDWLKRVEKNIIVADEEIKEALIATGNYNETKLLGTDLQNDYNRFMYATIQKDEKYKRIHNYSSAKLLYRNLMCAIVFAQIATCLFIRGGIGIWLNAYILVPCCVGILVLGMRWRRFYWKTIEYTKVWFVERYHEKTK
ncbi:hypothetical protein [Blautia glucerasea]|mgnify:CR=1 FL=1|uniref:hypothetical protein n=1 Tax=Blautia glucerasea TaxID=536633 RepID=UPI001D07F54F|nr:hypothetical protein [Blautia glucerasea]MCB6545885.1 hypothetical protein [Blautia glucerasea]